MDDLNELTGQAESDIQELEALVASAEARVAVAQADAAAARQKLSEARIVLEWLRRRSQPQPVAASPVKQAEPPAEQADQPASQSQMRFGKPVPEGDSKLQKCLDALGDLGGAASNKQISSRTGMTADHVRGLLKYATTKKEPVVVTEPGSGVWRLTRSLNGAAVGER